MNVHKGDIAIVVHATNAAFVGSICLVVGDPIADPLLLRYEARFGPHWVVRFPRAMPWGVAGADPLRREGCLPDAWLRKITRPDIAESVLREVGEEVTA